MNQTWKATPQNDLRPLVSAPRLSLIEFQDESGEWHVFELLHNDERIVFGGCCNVGFLESGYIEKEGFETLDETLQELIEDLEVYYNDGPSYVSRIVCNERM